MTEERENVQEKDSGSGRIVVRHAEPGDAEALHRILTGPRVVEGTLQLPLRSVEAMRKSYSEPNAWRRRHVGEIGMAVRDAWQGKGVGTTLVRAALELADNWLGLTRMELNVYSDNVTGIALCESFGFEIEGTHRRFASRNGRYADAYSMARLKD